MMRMLPDLRLLSAFLLVPVQVWPPLSARLVPSAPALSGQTWQILLPAVLRSAAELPQVFVVSSAAGLLDAAVLPQVSAVLPTAEPLSAVQPTGQWQVSVVPQAAVALPAVVSWFFAVVLLFASGLPAVVLLYAVELPPVMPLYAAGLLPGPPQFFAGLLPVVALLYAAELLPAEPLPVALSVQPIGLPRKP